MKKEKAKYESPQTKKTQVNLESGICASSIDPQNPDGANGRIKDHQVNTDFNFNYSNQTQWDEIANNN